MDPCFPPFCSEGIENLDSSCKLHQELTQVSKISCCFLAWISLVSLCCFPLSQSSSSLHADLWCPSPMDEFFQGCTCCVPPGVAGELSGIAGQVLAELSCSRWEFCPGLRGWAEPGARGGTAEGLSPSTWRFHVSQESMPSLEVAFEASRWRGGGRSRPWEGGREGGAAPGWNSALLALPASFRTRFLPVPFL